MHPVICTIGPFNIYSYGLMLAIAVLVGTFFITREAKQLNIRAEEIQDFIFWTVVAGIVGARLLFIILNLSVFIENPLEMVMLQNGGLAWQGSLVASTLTGVLYLRRKKWPLKSILDLVVPYIALGQAIGRIGCFLNGCCYGKPVAWGIYFPNIGERLHPTQIYLSLGALSLFFILQWYKKQKPVVGSVFFTYLLGEAVIRFCVEFYRADHDIVWFGLSVFQWFCLLLFCGALYGRIRLQRQ